MGGVPFYLSTKGKREKKLSPLKIKNSLPSEGITFPVIIRFMGGKDDYLVRKKGIL